MRSSLLDETLALFRERTETLEVIERNTGLGKPWLQKLVVSKHPSVVRVQALYEYLAQKKLKL